MFWSWPTDRWGERGPKGRVGASVPAQPCERTPPVMCSGGSSHPAWAPSSRDRRVTLLATPSLSASPLGEQKDGLWPPTRPGAWWPAARWSPLLPGTLPLLPWAPGRPASGLPFLAWGSPWPLLVSWTLSPTWRCLRRGQDTAGCPPLPPTFPHRVPPHSGPDATCLGAPRAAGRETDCYGMAIIHSSINVPECHDQTQSIRLHGPRMTLTCSSLRRFMTEDSAFLWGQGDKLEYKFNIMHLLPFIYSALTLCYVPDLC